ncbi:MAG TPA: hypothetical protein ENK00_02200 [Chromatiales bacterium]|nr:hypothetical protein [Chromatiales bacterium]
MSQPITVRRHEDGHLEWFVPDSAGSGRIHRGSVDDLPPDGELHLLVPGERVLCRRVETPARSERELARALPYQLEDELAQDIEDLFFAFRREGRGRVRVLITEQRLMQAWLDGWPDTDAIVDLRPDYLALPMTPDGWTLLIEDERLLLCTADGCGTSIEASLAQPVLHGLAERQPPQHITAHLVGEASLPPFPWPVAVDEHRQPHALAVLGPGALEEPAPVNLRQGPWAPARRHGRGSPAQARLALAAAIVLALGLGLRLADLLAYRSANQQAMQEMVRIYRETFPDARRVVNPRVQLAQRLKALESASGQADDRALGLLDALARAWQPGLEPVSLQYREGRLELRLAADSLSRIEALRKRLQEKGVNTSLASASNEGGRTRATLRIEAG